MPDRHYRQYAPEKMSEIMPFSGYRLRKSYYAWGFRRSSGLAAPTAEELANIAVAAADSARSLAGIEPRVAMLSFSTKGSAKHENVEKVQQAVTI